jgi:hypothetical protein
MRIAQHFSAGIKRRFTDESVKRTTEIGDLADFYSAFSPMRNRKTVFQPSASRTDSIGRLNPSDKSLGYFQVVRGADDKGAYLLGKPS